MNIEQVRAKLAKLNKTDVDRPDHSKIFWKPEIGKHVIRVVPSKYEPEMQFSELRFHYGIGKFPMIALTNFGEQDPIDQYVKELRKETDKESWSLAGKLSPKSRYFTPVIVRGEEEKGVRLWNFGINVYKAFLGLAEDEEVGDFTDISNGRDFTVEVVAGNPYPSTTIRPKMKQTPLSDNAEKVKLWLEEQPNPIESFQKNDYDTIKQRLKDYIEGKETVEETAEKESEKKEEKTSTPAPVPAVELPLEDEDDLPINKPEKKSVKKQEEPVKQSKAKSFSQLFDEED